jgi:hypothetical protein
MTAATEDVYFANMGTVAITSPVSATLAIVKDVEATFQSDELIAYGFGSALGQAKAKYNFRVAVKVGFIKFLPTTSTWWPLQITNPGTGSGAVTDTNAVQQFTVTALFLPLTSGNTKLLRTVTGVVFPNFPLKATENQWVKVDLEGEGVTLADTNPA